jgi:hypothetical protein
MWRRLIAFLPALAQAIERHGRLELDAMVRADILAMSAAAIDRMLRACRERSDERRRWEVSEVAERASCDYGSSVN